MPQDIGAGTYTYRPLETPTTIRILRLQPGLSDDPLTGELWHTDLREDRLDSQQCCSSDPRGKNLGRQLQEAERRTVSLDLLKTFNAFDKQQYISPFDKRVHREHRSWIPYEALSYVWGKPRGDDQILGSEGSIAITTNLSGALRNIRHERLPRNIWADAICINQRDIHERGHQVRIMGRVYSNAEGVLVWLGPDSENKAKTVLLPLQGYSHDHHSRNPVWQARMKEMLSFQWFSRVWVVQELLLAREAIFLLGRVQLNASVVKKSIWQTTSQTPHWLSLSWPYSSLRFLDTLQLTRGMLCSDDRDRIYGFLGLNYAPYLPLSKGIHQLHPDYSLGVEQIYFKVACICVENNEVARLLNQVYYDPEFTTSLPSWVPDWRYASRPTPFAYIRNRHIVDDSSFRFNHNVAIVDQSTCTLCLKGIDLGSVSAGPEMLDPDSVSATLTTFASYWSQLMEHRKDDVHSHSTNRPEFDHSTSRQFLHLLTGDSWKGGHIPSLRYTNSQRFAALFEPDDQEALEMLNKHIQDTPIVMKMILSLIRVPFVATNEYLVAENVPIAMDTWRGRRLFETKESLVGLGPSSIRTDDQLILCSGGSYPFLLIVRKNGETYTLIGTAFVPVLQESDSSLGHTWSDRSREVKEFRLK